MKTSGFLLRLISHLILMNGLPNKLNYLENLKYRLKTWEFTDEFLGTPRMPITDSMVPTNQDQRQRLTGESSCEAQHIPMIINIIKHQLAEEVTKIHLLICTPAN